MTQPHSLHPAQQWATWVWTGFSRSQGPWPPLMVSFHPCPPPKSLMTWICRPSPSPLPGERGWRSSRVPKPGACDAGEGSAPVISAVERQHRPHPNQRPTMCMGAGAGLGTGRLFQEMSQALRDESLFSGEHPLWTQSSGPHTRSHSAPSAALPPPMRAGKGHDKSDGRCCHLSHPWRWHMGPGRKGWRSGTRVSQQTLAENSGALG